MEVVGDGRSEGVERSVESEHFGFMDFLRKCYGVEIPFVCLNTTHSAHVKRYREDMRERQRRGKDRGRKERWGTRGKGGETEAKRQRRREAERERGRESERERGKEGGGGGEGRGENEEGIDIENIRYQDYDQTNPFPKLETLFSPFDDGISQVIQKRISIK